MDGPDIIAVILGLIGWFGTIAPAIPGVFLIFAAALVHGLLTQFSIMTPSFVVTMGVLAAGTEGLGYVATAIGARTFGARKAGLIGATAGLIIGLVFMGPLGILLGPLLGAVAAEALTGRSLPEALRAGFGAVVGSLGSMVVRFLLGGIMFGLLIHRLFFA